MFKKIGLVAALVTAALIVIPMTGLGSYTGTIYQKLRGSFKKTVPIEFEIERVRHEVAQLVPDMKKNLTAVAEEMVAVKNLKKEIIDMRASLKTQKAKILAMTETLESGKELVVYEDGEFNPKKVADRLSHDMSLYQLCEKELRSKEKILEAKEESLDKARKQLATIRDQKRELEVQIAQLEAQLKTVRLQQAKSKVQLDDSRLAQIKGSLADIRNRLSVEETEAALHSEFVDDDAPVVEKKTKPVSVITKEIRAYFGSTESPKVAEKK